MTRTKRASSRIVLAVLLLSLPFFVSAHTTYVGSMGDEPGYIATIVTTTEPPYALRPQTLNINLFDAKVGAPITDLDLVHGRKLHAFIVGEDLQTFVHMHPEDFPDGFSQAAQGSYTTHYTFPKGGNYAVVFDFTTNGKNLIYAIPERVIGETSNMLPKPTYNFVRTKTFVSSGGEHYTVTLRAPETVEMDKEIQLDYYIQRNGQEVTDLGMLLGAEMHVLVLRDDFGVAGHSHTYVPGHDMLVGDMTQRYRGPTIPVRYTFPQLGNYAVFGQFQRQGQVVTTQFMVHVEPPKPSSPTQQIASDWRSYRAELAIGCLVLLCAIALIVWSRRKK